MTSPSWAHDHGADGITGGTAGGPTGDLYGYGRRPLRLGPGAHRHGQLHRLGAVRRGELVGHLGRAHRDLLGLVHLDRAESVTATYNGDPATLASSGSVVVDVSQGTQTISFAAPARGTAGGSTTLSASGGASANAVVFSLDPSSEAGACTLSGDTVRYTRAGNCVIDANQAANADYSAAPQVTQTILVRSATTKHGGHGVTGSSARGPGGDLHRHGHRWLRAGPDRYSHLHQRADDGVRQRGPVGHGPLQGNVPGLVHVDGTPGGHRHLQRRAGHVGVLAYPRGGRRPGLADDQLHRSRHSHLRRQVLALGDDQFGPSG